MSEKIKIAVDAMGGENSPFKILKGSEIFLKYNKNVNLLFFGNSKKIEDIIKKNNLNLSNYEIIDCLENVSDDDKPNTILRSRKDSSIYKGLKFVKDNPNSGFVSAGNTAALMILSRLILGMIPGVDRPAICSDIPNRKSFSLMLDLGANVLVDASFDNPNYWIRTIVFLNALGVSRTQLIGVLGLARRTQQQRTLKRLGVPTINDLASDIDSSTSRAAAEKYLEQVTRREDILSLPLPYELPAE